MNKRFQKSAYDPGRFKNTLLFYRQVSTEQPDGGVTVSWVYVTTLKAVKEAIPHRLNNFAELENNAGQSILYHANYFVVRPGSFVPDEALIIAYNGETYTIRAIIDVDDPKNWWRLFCIKSDVQLTT